MPTLPAYNPVPVTPANIITFVKTDPMGCGVTAIAAANPGSDTAIENVVNVASATYQVPSNPVTPAVMETLYDPTEAPTFTTAINDTLTRMYTAGNIIVANANIQTELNNLFANYPKTLANIKSQYTRNGSPWEYYFGAGQVANTTVLDQARNGPPSPPNF